MIAIAINRKTICTLLLLVFTVTAGDSTAIDTSLASHENQKGLSQEEPATIRAQKRAERKIARKAERDKIEEHFRISVVGAYMGINSNLRYEGELGVFSPQISLEDHLGLEEWKFFMFGNVIYRINPRSGVFAGYYRFSRDNTIFLEEDVIVEDDTLYAGVLAESYMNSSVFSVGYLLSVLKSESSFFGLYFNAYLLGIDIGIESEVLSFNESESLLLPLPNLGGVAIFEIREWLGFSAGVGVFFIDLKRLSGTFLDVNAAVVFHPIDWLGISVGYNIFDVRVSWEDKGSTVHVNYNYSGPSVGVNFKF